MKRQVMFSALPPSAKDVVLENQQLVQLADRKSRQTIFDLLKSLLSEQHYVLAFHEGAQTGVVRPRAPREHCAHGLASGMPREWVYRQWQPKRSGS